MYTSASAIGSTSSASMPAGPPLRPSEALAAAPFGGAVGSVKDAAAPPPAAAAPNTLSWNFACAAFLRRHAYTAYPASSSTSTPSPPNSIGSSRYSSYHSRGAAALPLALATGTAGFAGSFFASAFGCTGAGFAASGLAGSGFGACATGGGAGGGAGFTGS